MDLRRSDCPTWCKNGGGGVIIAAGAIVTKDINEKNVIVAGNPAKVVKRF